MDDAVLMRLALGEAERAMEGGDVPVGAAIARDGEVLALAGNAREREHDPTAHAESIALRAATAAIGSWRLDGGTLAMTL